MKKIFSLLTVSLLTISSYAALDYKAPAQTWTVGDVATLDAYKWNSVTTKGYAVIDNDWYMFSGYDLYKAKPDVVKWFDYTAAGASTSTWVANGVFQGESYYEATPDGKTLCTRADRIYSFQVKNMSAFAVYCKANAEEQKVMVEIYDGTTLAASAETNTIGDTIMTIKGLDKEKSYIVAIAGTGDNSGKQNSFLYEIAFSISGNEPELDKKAVAPILSVAGGEYFEPFKVGLTSSKATKIFFSLNDAAYEEYKDSVEINEYDKEIKLSAFATLDGAKNSDTVTATYKLTHFVPRPVFKARTEINLIGITADDIQILSGDNATKAVYTMDGKDCPSVNYIHKTNGEGADSVMLISFKDRNGLTLRYKNGSDKANALKVPAEYIQCDSKNFEFYVDGVKGGDTIVFVVTAKGSAPKFDHTYSSACYINPYQPEDDTDPCFTDGEVYTKSDANIKDNYIGWTNLVYIVQEGHTKIRLKEVNNGCRMAKVLIGAYRGEAPKEGLIDGVVATKAVKRIVDGQIIIEKGDRKFNVLGAEIK